VVRKKQRKEISVASRKGCIVLLDSFGLGINIEIGWGPKGWFGMVNSCLWM